MSSVEVVEVDVRTLIEAEPRAVIAFEDALWHEQEPDEPHLSDEVALWIAAMDRPNTDHLRWIVRDGSGTELAGVATLALSRADNLHAAYVELRVRAPHRRGGIGRALLAACARRAQEDGRALLMGHTWDLVPSGEPFARAMGAEARQVVRRSDLDLRTVDRDLVARWLDVPERTRERYELWTVIGPYPKDQYEAIAEVETVMNTAPHDDLDVEDTVRDAAWVAQREAQNESMPGVRWAIFAREKATGRLVGYTQVYFYEDWPGHVDQGNTGVHPDHRGHRLGKWLKAAMIDLVLRERPDSFRIRTTNAFSNAPMLAINDELGFVVVAKQTAWQADVDEVLRRTAPNPPPATY